jgi:micrococcal nuclease
VTRRLGLTALLLAALVASTGATAGPLTTAASPVRPVAVSSTTAAAPRGLPVTVTYIVDGDTVHVIDSRSSKIKVRILGIDTPETRDPRKPVQCWGPEATAFATRTLLRHQVTLVTDPTQDVRDRYGRTLAYLYLPDGNNYSVLAAHAGAARSYIYNRTPVAEHAAISAAEAEARTAKRGLWGRCTR